jgi:hypothetical protein
MPQNSLFYKVIWRNPVMIEMLRDTCFVTFNHGVEGSSPSALTMYPGTFWISPDLPKRLSAKSKSPGAQQGAVCWQKRNKCCDFLPCAR